MVGVRYLVTGKHWCSTTGKTVTCIKSATYTEIIERLPSDWCQECLNYPRKEQETLTHQGAVLRQLICKAACLPAGDKCTKALPCPESISAAAACRGLHHTADRGVPGLPSMGRRSPLLCHWPAGVRENSTPLPWDRGMGRWMMQVVVLILTSRWGHCSTEIKWWRPHHGSMTAVFWLPACSQSIEEYCP